MLPILHMFAAALGLVLGIAAVRYPNGTRTHRAIGIGYLACWVTIGVTAFILGTDSPRISPFEILTVLGLVLVAMAYGAVVFRARIGRNWVRYHYSWMTASHAALVVTAVNQTLLQTVGMYPRWLFWAIVLSPFLYMPSLHRALDRRFAPARSHATRAA